MAIARAADIVERIIRFRCEMEDRLRKRGAPIPPKQEWDDAVTYNNSLLEAVEDAEARE